MADECVDAPVSVRATHEGSRGSVFPTVVMFVDLSGCTTGGVIHFSESTLYPFLGVEVVSTSVSLFTL